MSRNPITSTAAAGARVKSRRDASQEATRAALLTVARAHFGALGFAGADVARIAAEAGVTTGALYHHFGSKKALFQAVAELVEGEILAAGLAVDGPAPWQRLRNGFFVLLDVCAAPDVQRIIAVEAPQVLSPGAWREIELRYALGAVRQVLAALAEAGIIKPYPADLLARLLLALLRECATTIAEAPGDAAIRAQVEALANGVLDSLQAGSSQV